MRFCQYLIYLVLMWVLSTGLLWAQRQQPVDRPGPRFPIPKPPARTVESTLEEFKKAAKGRGLEAWQEILDIWISGGKDFKEVCEAELKDLIEDLDCDKDFARANITPAVILVNLRQRQEDLIKKIIETDFEIKQADWGTWFYFGRKDEELRMIIESLKYIRQNTTDSFQILKKMDEDFLAGILTEERLVDDIDLMIQLAEYSDELLNLTKEFTVLSSAKKNMIQVTIDDIEEKVLPGLTAMRDLIDLLAEAQTSPMAEITDEELAEEKKLIDLAKKMLETERRRVPVVPRLDLFGPRSRYTTPEAGKIIEESIMAPGYSPSYNASFIEEEARKHSQNNQDELADLIKKNSELTGRTPQDVAKELGVKYALQENLGAEALARRFGDIFGAGVDIAADALAGNFEECRLAVNDIFDCLTGPVVDKLTRLAVIEKFLEQLNVIKINAEATALEQAGLRKKTYDALANLSFLKRFLLKLGGLVGYKPEQLQLAEGMDKELQSIINELVQNWNVVVLMMNIFNDGELDLTMQEYCRLHPTRCKVKVEARFQDMTVFDRLLTHTIEERIPYIIQHLTILREQILQSENIGMEERVKLIAGIDANIEVARENGRRAKEMLGNEGKKEKMYGVQGPERHIGQIQIPKKLPGRKSSVPVPIK